MVGVNLSGAEYSKALPGVHGVDYVYPTADLKTYATLGIDLVRLPFRWERLQPKLGGALDQNELGRLKAFLAEADRQGVDVIVDNHNYGRYRDVPIGSASVPAEAFADFWKKLATELKGQGALVGYDLMNEPHDMGGRDRWPHAAQLATNAIRTVDMTHDIHVEGEGWSSARAWKDINGSLDIKDPANKIIYQAHQYFDDNASGTYDESYTGEAAHPNIGVDRLRPFTDWLKETGNKGFIGEFAVPDNDPRWLTVLDNFMDAMKSAGVDGTYWGGGAWWGNYPMALIGGDGKVNPQMAVVQDHADDLAGPVTSVPAPAPADPAAPGPAAPAPAAPPAAVKGLEGRAGNDVLTGTSAADQINGHQGNDSLKGLGKSDTLHGESGNDTLDGGAGSDTMIGGTGNDSFFVDNAGDKVGEAKLQGIDKASASISYTLPANVEDLVLSGTSHLRGAGNEMGNRITGNSGANPLLGGGGNDILRGADGADILNGGGGSDRFDFDLLSDSNGAAIDRIADFARGQDRIDLSSIDANSKLAGNQAFAFIGSKAFTGVAGQVHFTAKDQAGTTGDHLLLQADVNGDRTADFTLRVDGLQPLQAGDLIL
jgi:aryl-phospho-beta-D-glucosidase BglC (GH1 family)